MTSSRFVASLPAAAMLTLFTLSGAVAAPEPDPACRAAKLKAAGKYASARLGCEAKAAKDDSATDPECLAKGTTKFSDAFATAETKYAVDCNGEDSTMDLSVIDTVAEVEDAVPIPAEGGDCASAARKAAGKFASSFLGAWSKFTTTGDAVKRDASLTKARETLATKMAKAETKTGCTASSQSEAVRTAVENGLASIAGCLASSAECIETTDEASPGEVVTTDPDSSGPDATETVTAGVETPNAGTVVLRVSDSVSEAPSGYDVLGVEIDVQAPDATALDPLVLTFTIDASVLPADPNTVEITRNGVLVADCSGAPGVASPDPCVASRTVLGSGDLQIVCLTSQASLWTPLVPEPFEGCPTLMLWELRADDTGDDRATEIDVGWKGLGHDMDPASGSAITMDLDCSAAVGNDCGVCDVTGFDASSGNCRCSNDSRLPCDEPLAADADHCGGNLCECYLRVPSPFHVGGVSSCVVSVADVDASGTWDPATGSGSVVLDERLKIHFGISTEAPCPYCDGDVTPGDGMRDGSCVGGPSNGLGCDSNASDPTFPFPGGGFYSLDCMPSIASNITGTGMRIAHTETTGSTSLASSIPCAGGSGSCPCAVCSLNSTIACSSDAQCSSAGAGTCTSTGSGSGVQQDNCSGSCVVDADNEGECDSPSGNFACDGAVDEEGKGFIPCTNNTDCSFYAGAGNCTLPLVDECFSPTISATGVADAAEPTTVAVTCVPPTSNGSVNSAMGLPGPGRVRSDWFVTPLAP